MTRVMVFGSFDPLHDGHRSLFRQAKEHGDELVVVVARDASILKIKGRPTLFSEAERLSAIQQELFVDRALLGDATDFFKPIEKERPDAIVLGYDQRTFSENEIHEQLERRGIYASIVRALAFEPETFKSSKIKALR
jgi:FAD synthetase